MSAPDYCGNPQHRWFLGDVGRLLTAILMQYYASVNKLLLEGEIFQGLEKIFGGWSIEGDDAKCSSFLAVCRCRPSDRVLTFCTSVADLVSSAQMCKRWDDH